jgi:hypothetical protein
MTSIGADIKQIPNDARYFVPVSSLLYVGAINARNATTGALTQATWMLTPAGVTAVGSATQGSIAGAGLGNVFQSSINGPGAGRLRDLGKTYISAGRAFRKVQLVWYGTTASTFGVNGAAGTVPDADYLTGYIDLGWEGSSLPAPVARMGP